MTEARPVDLIYGHLGEPFYDSENQRWHFARESHITRQIQPLGQPIKALESFAKCNKGGLPSAIGRTREIKALIQLYPELTTTAPLLLGPAPTSEVVNEITSSHDPIIGDLLAFGRALNATNPRSKRTLVYKPLAAVASGTAGEIVRLVVLSKEQRGWKQNRSVKLDTLTAKDGEEGWWIGNGSPIQQLMFAGGEGESSTWLAVRYHGAISILKPVLRAHLTSESTEVYSSQLPSSRLDANHILTLSHQETGGLPFTHVCFNPWDRQQIAAIDQKGNWNVWSIQAQHKGRGLWTTTRRAGGSLIEDHGNNRGPGIPFADGWGSVCWTVNNNTVLVTNRRSIAAFDIKAEPKRLPVPDLALALSTDWILDVKRSALHDSHVFVTTSSRIFWLHFISAGDGQENVTSGVSILLSWVHYRNPGDTSLRLNVIDGSTQSETLVADTNIALLYSRLANLITIFTLRYFPSTGHAVSASDPYLLSTNKETNLHGDSGTDRSGTGQSERISCVELKLVAYDIPKRSTLSETRQLYVDKHVQFYQLVTLYNDLALSERLYVGSSAGSSMEIGAPDISLRSDNSKTSVHVIDDFVVQDGIAYEETIVTRSESSTQRCQRPVIKRPMRFDTESWTIDFEWLRREIQNPSQVVPFDDYLERLYTAINNASNMSEGGIKTLLDVESTENIVTDVDSATNGLSQLLESATQLPSNDLESDEGDNGGHPAISISLPAVMSNTLGFQKGLQLSQVYDSLVQAYITPLPQTLPGRVRITLDRLLRDAAVQISLSAHTFQVKSGPDRGNDDPQGESSTKDPSFTLPVRRKASASNLSVKGSEKAATQSIPPLTSLQTPLTSSQISIDTGFQPHQKPEPTPSLRSRSSVSSLPSEDPSSQRLGLLTTLTPQPPLPPKLSSLLSHWSTSTDPSLYDWEAAQAPPEAENEVESDARAKRREKRRKRQRDNTLGSLSQSSAKKSDLGEPHPVLSAQAPPTSKTAGVGGGQPPLAAQAQQDSSSQITASNQAGVMSQPTSSAVGARGAKKTVKAREKRKKGF